MRKTHYSVTIINEEKGTGTNFTVVVGDVPPNLGITQAEYVKQKLEAAFHQVIEEWVKS